MYAHAHVHVHVHVHVHSSFGASRKHVVLAIHLTACAVYGKMESGVVAWTGPPLGVWCRCLDRAAAGLVALHLFGVVREG